MDFPVWPFKGNSMTFIPIFVLILLCALSALSCFCGPLGQTLGPFDARFSRLWMIKQTWQGDMHRTMIKLHTTHGKSVRAGPNEVSLADLSCIKKIYAPVTKFSKSSWYGVFKGRGKFELFAVSSYPHFQKGPIWRLKRFRT